MSFSSQVRTNAQNTVLALQSKLQALIAQEITIDAALAETEATWASSGIAMPLSQTRGGMEGTQTKDYAGWLAYWNGRKTAVAREIEVCEAAIQKQLQMVQNISPFFKAQVMRVN